MKHKEKILELRAKGYSYKEIEKELNCSLGTISYHLTKGQKEKSLLRNKNRKAHPFASKITVFKQVEIIKSKNKSIYKTKKLIYLKVFKFHNTKGDFKMKDANFTVEDVINKIGENPKCYLTGDIIDINSPRTYQFDHIVPKSRGGSNTLDNLGICTKIANQSKTDMTKDEYIEHCKKVLIHNGYQVVKEQ